MTAKIELIKPRNDGCKLTQGFSQMAAGSLSQSQCDSVGAQPGLPVFNVAGTDTGNPSKQYGTSSGCANQRWPPGSIPRACCGSPSGISGPTRSYKSSKFSSTWPANVKCTVKMLAVNWSGMESKTMESPCMKGWGGVKCRVKDKTHSAEKEGSS